MSLISMEGGLMRPNIDRQLRPTGGEADWGTRGASISFTPGYQRYQS